MATPRSFLIVLVAGAATLVAAGCGSEQDERAATDAGPAQIDEQAATDDARPTPPDTVPPVRTTPPPAPRPLPGLPADTAGFQDWTRLNAQPIPPDSDDSRIVGFDAHRSTKNVYVNLERGELTGPRGGQRLPYPDGTVLLKEGSTDGVITLIAVMRKITGVDPAHGDWQFIEWKRSAGDQPFETSPSLQDATCWSCHATAVDRDWVFTALAP